MPAPATALDDVVFEVSGDNDLSDTLKAASLIKDAQSRDVSNPRELMAVALADYGRLTETLYANGYYSGVINIRLDGREAANIPPFEVPSQINRISISVTPGPAFQFSTADVTPLVPGYALPEEFRPGAAAESTAIQAALDGAAEAWRDAGHAKVSLSDQSLTADHARNTISARMILNPGPKVRLGQLLQSSQSNVRADRIQRIAGFPSGEVFSPEKLRTVAKRLRRTGAFASVSLTEMDELGTGDTMDIGLALVDEKPRRFGAGAELSSLEGLTLTGFWMHRNFLGGAERFRVDGEVSGIGGQSGGIDYELGARLDQPATFGPDTGGFLFANLAYEDEPGFISRKGELGGGVNWILSDTLEAELGIGLRYSETTDFLGDRDFFLLTLPATLTWDRRDDILNPANGFYLRAEATPFLSLNSDGVGARLYADGRAYRGFGDENRFVLAGRAQIGAALAGQVNDIPPDYLFYSGGGNSVRGQPYQSLGVIKGDDLTGGQGYLALSLELRGQITDTIGVVGFFDAGHIGESGFFGDDSDWHSGAGLGLRYQTPIGPLRLDVGYPVSGATGDGVQVYIGIGQAF
ncbi:autotransporter assembly complex protein TamA [Aliiroseovarius sp. KMU-50]|uniref:Autotransporter assembly complex protein TamA n=1 Tax=Aliiroseovarius salicola TaxID=3009082 RepID=A0ABT4W457_9RHOB|nr:autotransporter assembly complex family protein [Aliiroseovarius sp. KMU-50]MDA5095294.1 autotransporter assembly complex protein TamA [Aliiroseovarius sp. KMU-50]